MEQENLLLSQPATTEFYSLTKLSPIPRRSYLVKTKSVGYVYDVAFFEGIRPDGQQWWLGFTGCQLSPDSIMGWAAILEQ